MGACEPRVQWLQRALADDPGIAAGAIIEGLTGDDLCLRRDALSFQPYGLGGEPPLVRNGNDSDIAPALLDSPDCPSQLRVDPYAVKHETHAATARIVRDWARRQELLRFGATVGLALFVPAALLVALVVRWRRRRRAA